MQHSAEGALPLPRAQEGLGAAAAQQGSALLRFLPRSAPIDKESAILSPVAQLMKKLHFLMSRHRTVSEQTRAIRGMTDYQTKYLA
jgi:hypothetical protein